ncbi:cell wall metabolism sensor histidine kinase WalK [Nocardioides sp. LS1]|uniref:sensor histidine kinase n=1 Tax=Nocardioides sp. LS1 TaxID=1027620 RepID=UPI000F6232A2|nr:ATP-binding protein [Nocardioides sp. LS1]GCD88473.1 two-component sensor histidine kinase [Nocardioides sp. LS1]
MRGFDMRGRGADTARLLGFGDQPDPRILQAVFAVLFSLDLGLRLLNGSLPDLAGWPTAAIVAGGVACVLAVAVAWEPAVPVVTALVPVLDLAALGMARMNPEASGAGILAVVPALWLGRSYGRRGALVTFIGSTLLVSLPAVLYAGIDGIGLTRSLAIPLVATWASLAVASGRERIRTGRAEVDRALGTIEHQRRVAEAILDTVDVGLVLLDRDGGYQSMNKQHADFMQLAFPAGHSGRAGQLGSVYHPDGTPVATEEMPSYRASHGEEFDDCRIWCGDDPLTRRALSVSARSVRDQAGNFAGAALAYKDVTDFMRALSVKDEFVASVSHELRTPLTSISGYVDLLLEREDLPAEAMRQLEVVDRNGDRLRRLVADLLHTAQVDDGPLHVVRTTTDLARIVRDAVQAATPVAAASDIIIKLEAPERLELVVDAQRMAQVVDNLVSNAIKYTSRGGEVRVRLEVDSDRVELCVTDTGIGIDAGDRDRLFTRFFRSREAAERSIQGVGLGLSITKDIVESHGGRIEVDSEVGRGSEFRVRIPVA